VKESKSFEFFASCLPGIEPFLAQEMVDLGLVKSPQGVTQPNYKIGDGGIEFSGALEDLYRSNLWLRTANRVLVRLGSFYAIKFVELRRKAGNLPWELFLQPGQPVSIRTTCKQSKLYHSAAVTERVLGAIGDRLGKQPEVEAFDEEQASPQLVVVRLNQDQCTISIDSSAESLHRRGYRQAVAKAPIRETLAAAIILAAGWDQISPLLDPFCGSGVIPIEAALMAARLPPGIQRSFSFEDWPGYDQKIFKNIKQNASSQIRNPSCIILGSDRDTGAIRAAIENADRAGVTSWIRFSQAAISAIHTPPGPGWVVTNPPYGVRISHSQDLRGLYTQFGKVLKTHCPGWNVAYLCNDDHLASLTRLKFEKGVSLNNGGIPVKLTRAKVPIEAE